MTDADLQYLEDQLELNQLSIELQLVHRGLRDGDAETLIQRLLEAQTRIDSADARIEIRQRFSRLNLSRTEGATLWFFATLSLRAPLRHAVRLLSGEDTPEPSLDVVRAAIFGDRPSLVALRELGPTGTLRKYDLIEQTNGATAAMHDARTTWTISRRLLQYLCGDDDADATFPGFPPDSAAAEFIYADGVQAKVSTALRASDATVLLLGPGGTGRRSLLAAEARAHGLGIIQVDVARLSHSVDAFRRELRSLARECRLLQAIPLFANLDAIDDPQGERRVAFESILPLFPERVLVTSSSLVDIRWDRTVITLALEPISTAHRARLWRRELGQGTAEDAEALACAYPLAPAKIALAARAALVHAGAGHLEPEHVLAGIRDAIDGALGRYGRRLTVTQSWEDIVLSADALEVVHDLLARIRQRHRVYEQWGFATKLAKGLGVSALLSGPPGTGKTMLAGLIARTAGLAVYQVDLSRIMSKYIGETERNLSALFDAAEACHAVLLFDEADSLFGKRTDVKSSNDRHANLETNFLLQRLESFTGICLLTTNHESNIDSAFQRRFSLHLRFDVPDEAERAALWRAMLPAAAPVERVDFDALARRYSMSAGYIRNAALRAAFAAASENTSIQHVHLERAAMHEYAAMGKIA